MSRVCDGTSEAVPVVVADEVPVVVTACVVVLGRGVTVEVVVTVVLVRRLW